MEAAPREAWSSGAAYEQWVGRWSRRVAPLFVQGLAVPAEAQWADVGCGTGALTQAILSGARPAAISCIDKSQPYVDEARRQTADARCTFEVGDAMRLPWADASVDAAVSGLVLNFVPEPPAMAAEMTRITRAGGQVAVYVWDYGGGMQMMRIFWDTAKELHPEDAALDQAERFPICQPDNLRALWEAQGLSKIELWPITLDMPFRDFDDFWMPLLGRQGSAPGYVASLDEAGRAGLREALRERLPIRGDGSFTLQGRAWAIRGTK
jgi:trans-aconitate methyltransferase